MPRKIANRINREIKGIGAYRSELLARTEVVRAHHIAAIQQYEEFGMDGVKVSAEWITARDGRVCNICAPLDFQTTGKVWSLDEIKNKIPVHPLCRCAALPHIEL